MMKPTNRSPFAKAVRFLAPLLVLAASSCLGEDLGADNQAPPTTDDSLVQAAAAPVPGTAYVTFTFDKGEKPPATNVVIASLDLPPNTANKYVVSFMVGATSDRKGTDGVHPWFGCRVTPNLGNVQHQIQYFPTLGSQSPAGRYATVSASGLIVSGGLVELVCRSFDVGFKVQQATYTAVAGAGLVIQ